MRTELNEAVVKQLFTDARTHHGWLNKSVPDELLQKVYELAKWGPTSLNSLPMRVVFIKSPEQKEKLYPALFGSNPQQAKEAPVTAIIAYDVKFYEQLPKLFPHGDFQAMYANNQLLAERAAFQSGTLQGAYFMLAARALGLDVGPMAGFDNAKVDETFLRETSWKSNFLCNLGYGDDSRLFPRGPRLDFDFVCRVI